MIKAGFRYTVKYVKDRETRSGSVTDFQIGDKVKDSNAEHPAYWNIRVTVWDGIDLNDGDKIVIDSIQSIEAREYNGKTYYDMTATCHVDTQERPAQKPASPTMSDEDARIQLPFDMDDLDP